MEILGKRSRMNFFDIVFQISLLVEPLVCFPDHYFRLVDGEHVQKDERLPQMILRACCADPESSVYLCKLDIA